MDQLEKLSMELDTLYKWFEWYDTQVIQHQRDIRMNNSVTIDIHRLDKEAIQKASKIKEIKKEILKK